MQKKMQDLSLSERGGTKGERERLDKRRGEHIGTSVLVCSLRPSGPVGPPATSSIWARTYIQANTPEQAGMNKEGKKIIVGQLILFKSY